MKVNESRCTYFNVDRNNIFLTCKLTLQRSSFDPFNRVSVNFVDFDGKTEGAIDGGGPAAEMFRLCLEYFQSSCLFQGSDTSKTLSYCIEQVNQKNYFYCSQIIRMSLLHGFHGPNFLSEVLFNFLCLGIDGMDPTMDDLEDGKLKSILQQFTLSNDLEEMQNIILEEDMISISGWSFINIDQKESVIKDVLKFHLAHRVRPALDQFEDGLKSCGMHSLIAKFPSNMKELFCFVPNTLTFVKLKELFTPCLSVQGSNSRLIENLVLVNYYNFLVECEEGDADVTLRDILIFATGCIDIPPLGFRNTPTIEFLHNTSKKYPEASTCGLILKLPVIHSEYINFKNDMSFGIKNGAVFGFE
ncbi:hypothetical protein FQR65_LT19955 [Abscondita terminalis]|nr:hypothetical protein FQR65_LT19955 [Abscondita terminalis]